jgi:hypothetical protein
MRNVTNSFSQMIRLNYLLAVEKKNFWERKNIEKNLSPIDMIRK